MTDMRVGIDIGGTFTDIVFLTSDGTVWTHKTLSTPDDYSRAIRDGVQSVLPQTGRRAGDIQDVLHGTTVATNAILEGKGAKTGLLTTKGFGTCWKFGACAAIGSMISPGTSPSRWCLAPGEEKSPSA